MGQEGYTQISVTEEAQEKLLARKLKKQAKERRTITWDEFLLESTNLKNRR